MAANVFGQQSLEGERAMAVIGTVMGDIFGYVGPASLKSWCDGKRKSMFTYITALFHTLTTLVFFGFAVWMLWYYSNHDSEDCSRLFMYLLVTSIVLLVYIFAGLLCGGSSNAILAIFHLCCCFSCVFLFLNIWSIFGGVWVFSAPGKFYPVTCEPRLVSVLQGFLIFYWSFIFLFGLTLGIYALHRQQEIAAHPEYLAEQIRISHNVREPARPEEQAPLREGSL